MNQRRSQHNHHRRTGRNRARTRRNAARRDRAVARLVPRAGRALLFRGANSGPGRLASPLPGRNDPQSIGPRSERLRRGLTRRGIIAPAAALAAALSPSSASASVSSHLCETTARAAISFAVGQSGAPAAALAREVLRSMMLHKFKLAR